MSTFDPRGKRESANVPLEKQRLSLNAARELIRRCDRDALLAADKASLCEHYSGDWIPGVDWWYLATQGLASNNQAPRFILWMLKKCVEVSKRSNRYSMWSLKKRLFEQLAYEAGRKGGLELNKKNRPGFRQLVAALLDDIDTPKWGVEDDAVRMMRNNCGCMFGYADMPVAELCMSYREEHPRAAWACEESDPLHMYERDLYASGDLEFVEQVRQRWPGLKWQPLDLPCDLILDLAFRGKLEALKVILDKYREIELVAEERQRLRYRASVMLTVYELSQSAPPFSGCAWPSEAVREAAKTIIIDNFTTDPAQIEAAKFVGDVVAKTVRKSSLLDVFASSPPITIDLLRPLLVNS